MTEASSPAGRVRQGLVMSAAGYEFSADINDVAELLDSHDALVKIAADMVDLASGISPYSLAWTAQSRIEAARQVLRDVVGTGSKT